MPIDIFSEKFQKVQYVMFFLSLVLLIIPGMQLLGLYIAGGVGFIALIRLYGRITGKMHK